MKVVTDENSERVARYAFEYGECAGRERSDPGSVCNFTLI